MRGQRSGGGGGGSSDSDNGGAAVARWVERWQRGGGRIAIAPRVGSSGGGSVDT